MGRSLDPINTIATTEAPPDPAVLKAIGLSHSLETAVADLIDNSIDAGADRVLVRFVLEDGLITRTLFVDNGRGMTDDQISAAMTLGVRRDRPENSLGHFGMGLKAASFSQADDLIVLSRSVAGPVGRRMARDSDDHPWAVHELDPDAVDAAMNDEWTDFETATGTVVIWERLRNMPRGGSADKRRELSLVLLDGLRDRLAVLFHRLLSARRLRIQIDTMDAAEDGPDLPREVEPRDPFGYPTSGLADYPKELGAQTDHGVVTLTCHAWPPNNKSDAFLLPGIGRDDGQGFYLYRNDRLLSVGGWHGAETKHPRRRSARVEIDIDGHDELLAMTMEKSAVTMAPDLLDAIPQARADDGTTFADYLDDVADMQREANSRRAKRTAMLPPGQGIAPRTRRAIEREIPMVEGEEEVRIRWARLTGDDFVRVDRSERVLLLNEKYRNAVLKGHNGSVNDAPLVKALLYLVYEDIFRGTFYGPKDKDNVAMWGEILNGAVRDELDMYGQ